jgi:hypothetical protein
MRLCGPLEVGPDRLLEQSDVGGSAVVGFHAAMVYVTAADRHPLPVG